MFKNTHEIEVTAEVKNVWSYISTPLYDYNEEA
jgi:hypothetical protein